MYKLIDRLGEILAELLSSASCGVVYYTGKVVLSLDSVNRSLYINKSRFKCTMAKHEMFVTKLGHFFITGQHF